MKKNRYRLTALFCICVILCSSCRRRVVADPQEHSAGRYHANVSSPEREQEKAVQPISQKEQEKKGEGQEKSTEQEKNLKKGGGGKEETEEKKKTRKEPVSGQSSEKRETKEKNRVEPQEKKRNNTANETDRGAETGSERNPGQEQDLKQEQKKEQNPEQKQQENTGSGESGQKNDKEDVSGSGESGQEGKKPEETPSSEEADKGVDKEFGIIVDEYEKDFIHRMTIYPCQYLKVYYEQKEDYVTVNAGEEEHKLLIDAAADNVGANLGKDYLLVDDEWVKKKNPEFIVKCVDSSVLGSGTENVEKAQTIRDDIKEREGWGDIMAVQNMNILLVSEELLETKEGKLLLKYYVADKLHPELFAQTKIEEIKKQLLGESGIYAYS